MLACRMDALSREEQARHRQLSHALGASLRGHRELPDGFEFELEDDGHLFHQVTDWIPLERRCCPFLSFRVDWEADGPVRLQLTGPPGVKDFLKAELPALGGSTPPSGARPGE